MRPFIYFGLLFSLLCSFSVRAQENDAPRPDGWRGLILDVSKPEDAVRVLGNSYKDKTDKLQITWVDKWVSEKRKQNIFRKLEFKKIDDFNREKSEGRGWNFSWSGMECADHQPHFGNSREGR